MAHGSPTPSHSTAHERWQLIACGLALELLFVLMYVAGSYLDWYPSRLGSPAAWIEDHVVALARPFLVGPDGRMSLVAGAAYLVALAGAFGAYALSLRRAARIGEGDGRHLGIAVGFGGLFALSLLLQPYLASQDIFSYAFYARILTLYGHNPYVDVPRDFPFDPLFGAIFWKDQPSNYGPIWSYLSGLLALAAGQNVALTLAALKALVALFALLGIPLVWAILGHVSPQDRLAGTILYAWNPLLVVETSGNGHNDVVMAFFLLLGVWLYVRRRPTLGLAALMASALTKYVAVVLVPLHVLVLLRQAASFRERAAIVVRSGLVVAALVVGILPIYRGPTTFQVVSFGSNSLAYTNSPLELVFRELRVALGEPRDLASLPLRYRGSWVETRTPTVFWSKVDDPKAIGVSLPTNSSLLVVEPRRGRWLHVYEPRLDRFGYVPADEVAQVSAPSSVAAAGATAAALEDAGRSPTARRANLILRLAAAGGFLAAFAAVLRKTRTLADALGSSLLVLFLSYWLIETWFWPWYLVWSLAFAALQPRSRLTLLVNGLCLTTLVLNAQANVDMVPYLATAYEYRSMLIFGLPLAAAGVWLLRRRARAGGGPSAWSRLAAHPFPHLPSLRIAGLAVPILAVACAGVVAHAGAASRQHEPASPASACIAWETEYRTGVEYLRAQQYSQAAAALSRAAHHRPDLLDTYRSRFVAYLQTEKYDEAIADLTLLLSAEGEQPGLLMARGDAYDRKQRFDLALQDFARAMALDPLDPQPHRRLALVYFEQGQLDEALREQWEAISLGSASAPIYRELGDTYASLGQYRRALAMYDRALAVDDTYVQVHASRAAALRILGRREETIPDLQQVLVLSNDVDEKLWAQRTLLAVADEAGPDAPTTR